MGADRGLAARSTGPVMDDETFKNELLSRLDQIIELLASTLPEAGLEEPEQDDELPASRETAAVVANPPYLIRDELQDDYDFAVQRWKQQRPPG